jgi:AcrR family transcriptional regulator
VAEPSDANLARRAAILDAAMEVFSRYGFKKTSMDDLARAAGLSRQGLYLYFPTKEALFKAGVLQLMAALRESGRAALAREDLDIEARLLGTFEAVHGHAVGQPAENMNELLETAQALMGPVVDDMDQGVVADVARLLRSSGVASDWKSAGVSAKELAEHLCSTSYGVKHRASTPAEYRERMRVAVHIACNRSVRQGARYT